MMQRRIGYGHCLATAIAAILVSVMTSKVSAQPSNEEFLERARTQWKSLNQAASPQLAQPTNGATAYLPLQLLIRGQDEVSVDNMLRKLDERTSAGDISTSPIDGKFVLSHDGGQSSAPLNDPITVIRLLDGFVIADGHHDVFLALYLGAKTIPARVIDDLSHMSKAEAWALLKQRKLVYLRDSEKELARSNPSFEAVRDNPNRYLAALLALKVAARIENGSLEILETKGGKKPVWVKINDGVPFIEFYIAQVLLDAGIQYESSWGKDIPEVVVEKARAALTSAASARHSEFLSQTPVLASDTEAARVRTDKAALKAALLAFEKNGPMSCRALFSKP